MDWVRIFQTSAASHIGGGETRSNVDTEDYRKPNHVNVRYNVTITTRLTPRRAYDYLSPNPRTQ